MGNTCGITATYNQKQHPRIATPHAIDDIGGFRVDRDHAQYQYALLCVTRLAEKYMSNMFPDVHASLVEFGDRQVDYLTVTNELYNALSFPERPLKNNEVDATADCLAKEAISELARMYVDMLREEEHDVEETQPPDVAPPLPQQRKDVQDQAEFEMFYEDTLKMIVTDIEKKNVWQEETYFGNQSFHDLLERKEPSLAEALCAASEPKVVLNWRSQSRSAARRSQHQSIVSVGMRRRTEL